jgi:hypothetical protein
MEGVRKWLVACGASFGVREVHPYRWADADTRPEVTYITYTPMSLEVVGGPLRNTPDVVDHDMTTHSVQVAEVALRIELYNDAEYGLPHIAWCAIAAEKEQAIKNIFSAYNMAFVSSERVVEETRYDDERIWYHQRMDVVIRCWLDYAHLNRNHKVDTVVLSDPVVLE